MAGFDNGNAQSGLSAQAKQFGSVLRGSGPPVPQAGVLGDLYIDVQTWALYEKQATDQWGNYLFTVPATYQNTLKWFSAYLPGNDVGVNGDYCLLWSGFGNYGLQPSIFGPKANGCWPESGNGPDTLLDPTYAGYELPTGLSDEGAVVAFSASTQLIVAGLSDEYIISVPVLAVGNTPISQVGLQSTPITVAVALNATYTAEDRHVI